MWWVSISHLHLLQTVYITIFQCATYVMMNSFLRHVLKDCAACVSNEHMVGLDKIICDILDVK